MTSTNPTAAYTALNNTGANATTYKANIDANSLVAQRIVDNFAPHSHSSGANMTIDVDPGFIWNGVTLTEKTTQTSSALSVASGGLKRIDRAVVDNLTGVLSIISGTQSSAPVAPTITAGKTPIAQIGTSSTPISSATTAITNSMLVDERAVATLGNALIGAANTFAGPQAAGITPVTASTAATIALDFSLNNDFTSSMVMNATLSNPTNITVGLKGRLYLVNSTFALAYGSYWNFAGGTVPTVSSGKNVLYYDVLGSSNINAALNKGIA